MLNKGIQKYAVIRIGGQQFRVSEGEEILVGKLKDANLPAGKAGKIEPEVLMIADGEKINVGKPTVKGAKVAFKIVSALEKGDKVDVYHFKAKSRYKKHTGFRPQFTKLLIEKIS